MNKLFSCLFLIAFAPSIASAAEINITITDSANRPIKDAIVSFVPDGGKKISPADIRGPYIMAQKNVQFTPFVLAVPRGATVSFPNQDTISHHVYSFSPAQRFQLPLYGQNLARSQKFDNAGTVAIGCNIHDQMSAYIRVLDTPYFAQTDARGTARIALPNSLGKLSIWHPFHAAPNNEVFQNLDARRPNSLTTQIRIRRIANSARNY